MNRQELDALVGLRVVDAEIVVRDCGLEPQSYQKDQPVIALSLPDNVVQIGYDNDIVTSAETQASIDAKYHN